jgi:6-phosphogluconate dehydrogenase
MPSCNSFFRILTTHRGSAALTVLREAAKRAFILSQLQLIRVSIVADVDVSSLLSTLMFYLKMPTERREVNVCQEKESFFAAAASVRHTAHAWHTELQRLAGFCIFSRLVRDYVN